MDRRAWLLAAGMVFAPCVAYAQEPRGVHVHLEDTSTHLERKTLRGWELVCSSGCDREVPAGTYRLTREEAPVDSAKLEPGSVRLPSVTAERAGVRIAPVGEPFFLDPQRHQDVGIGPNGGRSAFIGFGVLGLVTGSIASTIGGFLFFVDSFHCMYDESSSTSCESEQSRLLTRDGLIAGAGVAVIITGAVLLGVGVHQPKVSLTERQRNIAQHVSSFAWRAPEPSRVGAASAPTFPLLTGRF
ncbi:hypothetical protein LZC95_35865 [Pendulispora brunnea]|uniref:ER membrane protein complex subunit 6 n=1 Tax=Pendulispora brunnea TaxID=2905690 RepID=A0ABZ2JZA6_9BACT